MARTPSDPGQRSPGQFITGALWNAQVKALNEYLTAPPVFSAYQTTAQSISNPTFTSFTLDTEVVDSDGGHSTVTNTSRYTATVPGTYLVIGTAGWSGAATGYRRCRITLNGSAVPGPRSARTQPTPSCAVSASSRLS
ncbi:hypothetical protein GO001_32300 [Streptomyces sp. NRRL B-1677]|uniref:hypothetical protein n=1 Tax=Streptomyces sp. NRRL B-1677 TaxID=2682966 RepID=UPI001892B4BA|nr:hypothetical protein [Streptomyces sp. NRRL B-1677]MBF6049812.1 hypothetical protein [Streptomyces sp. NRRL B-1677]